MPAKPRWLLSIPDAISQLEQLDRTLLTRRDIEHLFGVSKVRAAALMKTFGAEISPRGDRPLTPTRSSPRRFAALPGRFQDGGRSMPSCCASALPTSPRNIEHRWFPLQELAAPRCCLSRFHSVLWLPAVSPWVPTRTMRNPLPGLERTSPSSQKQ